MFEEVNLQDFIVRNCNDMKNRRGKAVNRVCLLVSLLLLGTWPRISGESNSAIRPQLRGINLTVELIGERLSIK